MFPRSITKRASNNMQKQITSNQNKRNLISQVKWRASIIFISLGEKSELYTNRSVVCRVPKPIHRIYEGEKQKI